MFLPQNLRKPFKITHGIVGLLYFTMVFSFFEVVFWNIFAQLVGIVLWNITTSFKKSAERVNLLPWIRIVVPLWPSYFHISDFQEINTCWVKCGCFQIHHQTYHQFETCFVNSKKIQKFGDLAILESPGRRFYSKKAASAEALTDVGLMVILNNHVSSAGWSGIPTAHPLDVI